MAKWKPRTDDDLDITIEEARERVRKRRSSEPNAVSAYYDSASERIMVELDDGSVFGFPAQLGQGLRDATGEELAEVEVTPSGTGLHWEKLDADLLVASVLHGVYGTARWMRKLEREGFLPKRRKVS